MVLAAAPLAVLAAAAAVGAAANSAFEDAAALMQRGLVTLEIMEGPGAPSLAAAVSALAALHTAAGDPHGESRAMWRRVVDLLDGPSPSPSSSPSPLNVSASASTLPYDGISAVAAAAAVAPTWERARARLSLAAAEAAAGDDAAAEGETRVALATLLDQHHNRGHTAASAHEHVSTALAIPAQAALAALLLKKAAAARGGGGNGAEAAAGPTPEEQDALVAYASLLGAQRATLGVHHPSVAVTLGSLGNLHRAAGRHEAAHALYARALALKEREGAEGGVLGETLSDVAGTFAELAGAQRARAEHGAALGMLERAHAIRVRAGGGVDDSESRDLEARIAEAAISAGDCKAADGEHEEALQLHQRALDVCRRLFGSGSGEATAAAAAVEASAVACAGRANTPSECLVLWRRAAHAAELAYSAADDRPGLYAAAAASSAVAAGTLAQIGGEFSRAVDFLDAALDIRRGLSARHALAVVMPVTKSAAFAGFGADAVREQFGIEARLVECLGSVRCEAAAAGNHAGAATSLERCLEVFVAVGGMACRGVAETARALAAEKSAQGQHDAAARLLERATGVWAARADPTDTYDAEAALVDLVGAYECAGAAHATAAADHVRAVVCFERALKAADTLARTAEAAAKAALAAAAAATVTATATATAVTARRVSGVADAVVERGQKVGAEAMAVRSSLSSGDGVTRAEVAAAVARARVGRLHRRVGASRAAMRRYPDAQREYEAALAAAELAAAGIERPDPPPPYSTPPHECYALHAAAAARDIEGNTGKEGGNGSGTSPRPPHRTLPGTAGCRLHFQQTPSITNGRLPPPGSSGVAAATYPASALAVGVDSIWSLPPAAAAGEGERGAPGSARQVVGALMDLASLHRAFGRRERARPLYQRALVVLERLSGYHKGGQARGDEEDAAATATAELDVAASGPEEWAEPYNVEGSEAVASAVRAFSAAADTCAHDPGNNAPPPVDPGVAAAGVLNDDDGSNHASIHLYLPILNTKSKAINPQRI
jgi:tetratricopeptide (TPR) repeat protein